MKNHSILRSLNITLLVWTFMMALGFAQRMPQDSWYLKKTVETGIFAGGITSDQDGNIYLSDAKLGLIKKFSPAYQLLQTWGGLGSGDGQFGTVSFQDAVRFRNWSHIGAGGLCFTAAQELVVCDPANHRVQVFSRNGQFLRKFGSQGANDDQFNSPVAAAVAADGKIYVADRDNHRIQVFSAAGAFISKFGTPGAFDGQFAKPTGLAFLPDGKVAVADSGNRRIQVFSASGVYSRKLNQPGFSLAASSDGVLVSTSTMNSLATGADDSWKKEISNRISGATLVEWGSSEWGGAATIPSDPSGVVAISAGGSHTVALNNDGTVTAWGGNEYGQTTIPSGLGSVVAIAAGGWHTVALKNDGTVTAWGYNQSGQTTIPSGLSGVVAIAAGDYHTVALKNDGTVAAWGSNWSGETTIPSDLSGVVAIAAKGQHTLALRSVDPAFFGAVCVLPNDDLVEVRESGKLSHYTRTFRTILPESPNAIPLPVVLSSGQRPGTGLVDVDFRVDDADDATVQVAAVAFRDGGTDLSDVIPIKTLVENTANKLGAGVATGQVHRFTWDARADVAGDFEQVQIEVLAKDARGLFNLDYIQIPSEGAQPRLKISKTPLKDGDFLSAWLWLIATGDTGFQLKDGNVLPLKGQTFRVPGLIGDYFSNPDFTGQFASKVDESFSFSSGSGQETQGVPFGFFSVRWTGEFVPTKTGTYSFSCGADDAVNIWMGGQKVVTEYDPGSFVVSAVANQPIPVRIDYDDRGRGWRYFSLTVTPPGEDPRAAVGSDFQFAGNYASGSSTTAAGRAFLLARMGLREASPAEILRAQEAGTTGVINQWTPPLQVGPGERPVKVNAYGFETADTGTWVVPVTP
jgi:hypothetical protein